MGCRTRASFGDPAAGRPAFCAAHRSPDRHVNLRGRRAASPTGRPAAGWLPSGGRATAAAPPVRAAAAAVSAALSG
jgi:hypothetical protein